MSSSLFAPVRERQRLQIIDSIRGVALLGILMMNIPFFANPEQMENLFVRNELSGPNFYTWWVVNGIFNGTMRAMFSMLFGAGCLLLLNRLEKKQMNVTPADIYYRRLIVLFLFGLINAFLFLWPGDILYAYAICGLFLYPLRYLKAKHFLMLSLAFLLFATVKNTYHMYSAHKVRVEGEKALLLEKQKVKLNEQQHEAKQKWIGFQEKISVATLQKEAAKQIKGIGTGNYFSNLATIAPISAMIEREQFYEGGFFDIMMMIFLGMAFFKMGVLTGTRSKRFYFIMMLIGYVIGLSLAWWRNTTLVAEKFDGSRMFEHFYIANNQFRRLFMMLGHLGFLILLYKYAIAKSLFKALSRVGQMAFSNYLMQSIICVTIFYGFGFGLFGKLQRYEEYYVVGAIWIFQLIFSTIWLKHYRFGPFEWVWRSLTYWKKQPMKRNIAFEESEEEIVMPALA